MKIKHVEKRERTGPTTVRVTTLCGGKRDRQAWTAQDARDLIRMVREGKPAAHYGRVWTFCPDCEGRL